MKNKEFQKLLKKNRFKSNSGFTLTELLVGIIMGSIVIGGLGWGLLQILEVTKVQTSKSKVRSETSRAFSFISDEMRRAQSIEVDMSASNLSTADNAATPDVNEEVAPNFSLPTGGRVVLALNIPNVPQRVVYYVAPPQSSVWRGPQVIYRWGPAFDVNGNYSTTSIANPAGWQSQALIDKVDDVTQTASCGGNDVTYQGFYACIVDDDGDSVVDSAGNPVSETADSNGDGFVLAVDRDVNGDGTVESADTAASDINGDGVINSDDLDINQDGNIDSEDNADADGLAITAQLFFTGGTDAIGSSDDGNYAAQTQVVVRSRTAPNNNSDSFTSYTMSYKTLGAVYGCNPAGNPPNGSDWRMRTDFINDSSNPDSEEGNRNKKWVHDPNRQPQPIRIDTTSNLIINSIPVGDGTPDCISKGGKNSTDSIAYANESISDDPNNLDSVYYQDSQGRYTDGQGNVLPSGSEPIFKDNPTLGDGSIIHRVSHTIDFTDPTTYNGYTDGNNDIYVGNGSGSRILFLRDRDTIPNNPGYDPDDNSSTNNNSQISLRQFLQDKGYADNLGVVQNINKNERIVIFEVGQTDTNHPGFDRQDNIFILSSDVFAKDAPNP